MAILTTLARVKTIAQGDAYIQSLNDGDVAVDMALEWADLAVDETKFGDYTEMAQCFFAAHTLSMMKQPSGGRGPLSGESVGGVSRSYTLPYLNRPDVLGATQYGVMYLDLIARRIPAFAGAGYTII